MPRPSRTIAPLPSALTDTRQALMRGEHPGKWLAWSEDESRIIAVGDSPAEIQAVAELAGCPRFIYDWVPPVESRPTSDLA